MMRFLIASFVLIAGAMPLAWRMAWDDDQLTFTDLSVGCFILIAGAFVAYQMAK